MNVLNDYNCWWVQQDGKKVRLDRIDYWIKVNVYTAIYPYECTVISVYAVPINKNTKYYQKIRAELHDDWSTDVLASSSEIEFELRRQLQVV